MKKTLSILGSTGSIGTQALEVVKAHQEELAVAVLACQGSHPELFASQVAHFKPELVVVYREEALPRIQEAVRRAIEKESPSVAYEPAYECGMEGLILAASYPKADLVLTSLVGMIGILPTMAAIRAGKDIALANKETLVCAGREIMREAKKTGSRILPVDSEHGAIFQCLEGVDPASVEALWITASGGPFRGCTREELLHVTLEKALHHPTWKMGRKITVDSATLMNKGFEMIEAHWLYGIRPDDIIPLVHPQSIVHSLVELRDGSVLAQLSEVDMRLPIEVMLLYPSRGKRIVSRLDLRQVGQLTFEPIDETVFPSIPMAREAMKLGGKMPALYNAANELAVEAFLREEIPFSQIFTRVRDAMDRGIARHFDHDAASLEELLEVRQEAEAFLCK